MKKTKVKHFQLSSNNTHLVDVFAYTHFVDLGVSPYKEIGALLKEAVFDFEKLVHKDFLTLDIQNQKKLTSKEQQSFVINYFYAINLKSLSNQLFLTYGLVRYIDKQKREKFAPLVLIPVALSHFNQQFLVRKVGNPLENIVLLDYLKEHYDYTPTSLPSNPTLQDIDTYCMEFEKKSYLHVRMGNLITYANITYNEIVINQNTFSLHKFVQDELLTNSIFQKNALYKPVFPMNTSQTSAYLQYLEGNNFKIEGIFGSGKTSTLMNIALSEVSEHKKVLYISNMYHTRQHVYKTFKKWGLGNYVLDIKEPFFSHHEQMQLEEETLEEISEKQKYLSSLYQLLEDYEQDIFSRVRNNRIIAVLNDLIYLQDRNLKILPVEKKIDLFQHEYEEVHKSIQKLETLFSQISSFINSVWKHIPLDHAITYPNQAITLAYKLHKSFNNLLHLQEDLQDLGLTPHNYYIRFRRFATNTKNLFEMQILSDWVQKDFVLFQEAFSYIGILRTNLQFFHHLKAQLQMKFTEEFFDFDFHSKIQYWKQSGIFQETGVLENNLNQLLLNRKFIQTTLNRFSSLMETLQANTQKINKLINWKFEFTEQTLKELYLLSDFMMKHRVWDVWLNYSYKRKYRKLQSDLDLLYQVYLRYKDSSSTFLNTYQQISLNEIHIWVEILQSNKPTPQQLRKGRKKIYTKHFEHISESDKASILKKVIQLEKDIVNYEKAKEEYARLTGLDFNNHHQIIEDIIALGDLMESIELDASRKIISKFLVSYARQTINQTDITKSVYAPFVLFNKAYHYMDKLTFEIAKYGFEIPNLGFVERCDRLKSIREYIDTFYKHHDEIRTLFKTPDKHILLNAIFEMHSDQKKYNNLKKEFYTNKKYKSLYGSYFDFEYTDLGKLIQVLSSMKTFVESFVTNEAAYDSLTEKKEQLQKVLHDAEISFTQASQAFVVYPKLFDDKIGGYYYDSFEENIAHLDALLHSKDELIVYLKIIEEFRILRKYKLFDLIEYLYHHEEETNLADSFTYTYFSQIWDSHKQNMNYNSLEIFESLKEIVQIENEIFHHNLIELVAKAKQQEPCFFTLQTTGRNYTQKIKKYAKKFSLVISDTASVNQLLNIHDYDIVLVDDAHIGSSHLYNQVILAKRLIIAGDKQYNRFIRKSLIARISDNALIKFQTRYLPMPKDCLTITNDGNGLVLSQHMKNKGLRIVKKHATNYVAEELEKNRDLKCNIFVFEISSIKKTYLKLVSLLLDSAFTAKEILQIMQDQVNITVLRTRYTLNAHVNVLDLEDFDIEFSEINTDRMIMDSLAAKEQVILCDTTDIFKRKAKNKFIDRLQKATKSMTLDFHSHTLQYPMETKLKNAFESRGFVALGNHNNLDFVFRKKNQMYGVLMFWDKRTLHYDTLGDYRLYNEVFRKNGWKILNIWVEDLYNDFEGTIQKVIEQEETYHGK